LGKNTRPYVPIKKFTTEILEEKIELYREFDEKIVLILLLLSRVIKSYNFGKERNNTSN